MTERLIVRQIPVSVINVMLEMLDLPTLSGSASCNALFWWVLKHFSHTELETKTRTRTQICFTPVFLDRFLRVQADQNKQEFYRILFEERPWPALVWLKSQNQSLEEWLKHTLQRPLSDRIAFATDQHRDNTTALCSVLRDDDMLDLLQVLRPLMGGALAGKHWALVEHLLPFVTHHPDATPGLVRQTLLHALAVAVEKENASSVQTVIDLARSSNTTLEGSYLDNLHACAYTFCANRLVLDALEKHSRSGKNSPEFFERVLRFGAERGVLLLHPVAIKHLPLDVLEAAIKAASLRAHYDVVGQLLALVVGPVGLNLEFLQGGLRGTLLECARRGHFKVVQTLLKHVYHNKTQRFCNLTHDLLLAIAGADEQGCLDELKLFLQWNPLEGVLPVRTRSALLAEYYERDQYGAVLRLLSWPCMGPCADLVMLFCTAVEKNKEELARGLLLQIREKDKACVCLEAEKGALLRKAILHNNFSLFRFLMETLTITQGHLLGKEKEKEKEKEIKDTIGFCFCLNPLGSAAFSSNPKFLRYLLFDSGLVEKLSSSESLELIRDAIYGNNPSQFQQIVSKYQLDHMELPTELLKDLAQSVDMSMFLCMARVVEIPDWWIHWNFPSVVHRWAQTQTAIQISTETAWAELLRTEQMILEARATKGICEGDCASLGLVFLETLLVTLGPVAQSFFTQAWSSKAWNLDRERNFLARQAQLEWGPQSPTCIEI